MRRRLVQSLFQRVPLSVKLAIPGDRPEIEHHIVVPADGIGHQVIHESEIATRFSVSAAQESAIIRAHFRLYLNQTK